MAGNEGGLPPERRLGMSKICVVLPELAGTEGVGHRQAGDPVLKSRPFFRVLIIFRHSCCNWFFVCVLELFG